MSDGRPTFESSRVKAALNVTRWLDEWLVLGDGQEPADVVIYVDDHDDENEGYQIRFSDLLAFEERPEKLLSFCHDTRHFGPLREQISGLVSRWRAGYSAAELDSFAEVRARRVGNTADAAEFCLRAGLRCFELDKATATELEDRGWIDIEGFEPLAPEEGVYELLCGQ